MSGADADGELAALTDSLRLARRELKLVRNEQERLAEQLQRSRRQRARLREQVQITAEGLAQALSADYWRAATRSRRWGRLGGGALSDEQQMVQEVEASPLFDASWYLRNNLDAVRDGLSPALHYVRIGGARGRDPSGDFDTGRYLDRHPEVAQSGLPPLVHHLRNAVPKVPL